MKDDVSRVRIATDLIITPNRLEELMNSKNIHIAQIRRMTFNHRGNLAAEIPQEIKAFAFLLEKDGEYINILDPMEDYPV